MVSGASAAPESIRRGELELKRSVRLSGETDWVAASCRSVPRSPKESRLLNNKQSVLFAEQIVCYRGGRGDASSAFVARRHFGFPYMNCVLRKSIPEAHIRDICPPGLEIRLVLFGGDAFGGLLRQLLDGRVAHFAGRHRGALFSTDVGGSEPGGEHAGDGGVESVGGGMKSGGIAQGHVEGGDNRNRIGDSLAGNVGRRSVHRLIERLAPPALWVDVAERGGRQHTQRTRQHRRDIGQHVAE